MTAEGVALALVDLIHDKKQPRRFWEVVFGRLFCTHQLEGQSKALMGASAAEEDFGELCEYQCAGILELRVCLRKGC